MGGVFGVQEWALVAHNAHDAQYVNKQSDKGAIKRKRTKDRSAIIRAAAFCVHGFDHLCFVSGDG